MPISAFTHQIYRVTNNMTADIRLILAKYTFHPMIHCIVRVNIVMINPIPFKATGITSFVTYRAIGMLMPNSYLGTIITGKP